MKRRLLAIFLSLTLMLSLVPSAWANETENESAPQETEDAAEPTPQNGEGETTPTVNSEDGKLDLKGGSIVITKTGYTQGNAESETTYTGEYTISGTTTENTITVTGGEHQITLKDVNIDVSGMHDGDNAQKAKACAFDIQGSDVTLTLEGTNVLKSGFTVESYQKSSIYGYCVTGWICAGLSVGADASLIIDGGESDTLTATAGDSNGYKITTDEGEQTFYWINGGLAAGIGTSCYVVASKTYPAMKEYRVGDITIRGGVVNANGSKQGDYGGAGIGGGKDESTITISGGTVTAIAPKVGSAGIGGSYSQEGKKHVVITGGTVVAKGGSAGIGGGAYQSAGTIEISGDSDVTAVSCVNGTVSNLGVGAGIGSGGGNFVSSGAKGSVINITGGTVTAKGGKYAAGIGGGGSTATSKGYGACASGNITITGGTVTATGGMNAPGIGSGSKNNSAVSNAGCGEMETIIISGGTITAVNDTGYNGTQYTLTDGTNEKSFGIGMGKNPSEDASTKFATWKLQTADGDAVQLIAKESVSGLERNGVAYTPATLVIDNTEYYLLPEGCYNTGAAGTEVMIPASAATAEKVTSLIDGINAFTTKDEYTQADVETVQGYEETYKGLSESLQYYVDQQTKDIHTLARIKEGFVGKVKVNVTLKNGEKTFKTSTAIYGNSFDFSKLVPTKANYNFDGWYLDETNMTAGDSWPYLSDTTLEAKWVSEITGEGTQASPYIIKSGTNLAALSHISLGFGTAEEYALFGKIGVSDANKTALLSAYYELDKNVDEITLTTKDTFYGITSFTGHFNGNDKNIALAIDTSGIVENEDKNENGDDVAIGSSAKRGRLKVTIGGTDRYLDINAGIFNSATGATIENFTTSGSVKSLSKDMLTAVVVGVAKNCTIRDITNRASLELGSTDNTSWAGGIAGQADADSAVFVNCHNKGTIKGGTFGTSIGNSSAAGICSYLTAKSATFMNCSNSGKLIAERQTKASGRYSNVGGIVGLASGAITATFTNCHNTGELSSQAETNNVVAGIVAVNGSNVSVKLDSCSNAAALSAKHGYAGALVSYKSGPSGMPKSATYTDCTHIMTGDAAAKDYKVDSVPAVAGESGEFTISVPITNNDDNFYNADRYVVDASGNKVADIASADYHYIYSDLAHNDNILEDSYPFQTEETAYVISTAEDYTNLVLALRGDVTAQKAVLGNRFSNETADAKSIMLSNIYVKLNRDITLTDLTAIGLGTDEHPFGGTILGQNHTVTYELSDAALAADKSSNIGFVGVSNGVTVQDLKFAGDVNVTVAPENGSNVYFGAAVVTGSGATVKNCHSKVNYTLSRTTTVENATGGFLEVGGLLGVQPSATVEDSSYTGNIAVTSPKNAYAGGIAADMSGSVKNCTVKGSISATLKYDAALPSFGENSYAGGIAGVMSGTLTDVTVAGVITASNDYSYAYAGGLVGNSGSGLTVNNGKALTTVKTEFIKPSLSRSGAMLGYGTATVFGNENWYVKTDDTTISGATAIDTTVLDGKTFGETVEMAVPDGVTMSSKYASLDDSTVSFIKATAEGETGTVELVYDGQTFFTTEITVAKKSLNDGDVIITGINDKYPSDEAASEATINVIFDGKELVKDTDYTVAQDKDSHKFTINFTGNYTGSKKESYTVDSKALEVTAKDYTGTYDGEAHSITVKAPEGATVEYKTEKTSYSTTNVEEKNAGTYVVYWQATKDGQSVTGSSVIVINKATLTIKADDQFMYVGGTVPTPTFTATGLVKGETLTHVDSACKADGKTVGKFDIIPSNADTSNSNDNYEIVYVNGTLTVVRRHSSPSSTTPNPEPTPDNSTSFVDVPASAYFADAVEWAVKNGVTNGLTDTMFGPYESCTRAQIVTFLWRAAGSPEPKAMSSFSDVPASAYYAKAVAWAVENGITNGMTETTFAPDATCTRGQSVTFLYRALGKKVESNVNFTDVKSDAFYADAVNWAVANNVTNGTSATTFSPNADCTRAEIVTFLYRAYQGK